MYVYIYGRGFLCLFVCLPWTFLPKESAVSSDRCGPGSRGQSHSEAGTKELEPAELIWALKSGLESKF